MNSIANFFRGYVEISIQSEHIERFLNLCAYRRIALWEIERTEQESRMFLSIRDFFALRPILRKTKTRLHVCGRYGLPFILKRCKKRWVYTGSIIVCFLTMYCLTLFVWKVTFTGNSIYSNEELFALLKQDGIQYGMLKSHVSCDTLERHLREEFNDIVWATVELNGTALEVQIKENTEKPNPLSADTPADLVSQYAGTVVHMVTRKGVPCVTVGQQVEVGDTLISGIEPRMNDAQEIIEEHYCQADGDIILETTISYREQISSLHIKKLYTKKKNRGVTLYLFGKPFKIFQQKKNFSLSTSTQKQDTFSIGNSFYLPIGYAYSEEREYVEQNTSYTKEELITLANQNFRQFKSDLDKKGVEIIENNVKILLNGEGCEVVGSLRVHTPAGTLSPRKELEFEGVPE